MKKNFFLSMCAAASMLLASSCSEDEIVSGFTDADYVNATFTLETPEGIQTRAIGEGENVNVVECQVFDALGEPLSEEGLRATKEVKEGKATFQARLVKGQDYKVAFFAYYKPTSGEGEAAYDVTDMKNIKVKEANSNVESRDAFTASVEVTADETLNAITKTVNLYRPFAQLNLGSVSEDIKAAAAAGITVAKSQIKVSNVYTAFNAYADDVVGDATEVTFALNTIPEDELVVDEEEYTYLALNYLLVGSKDTEKSLTNVEFTWETGDNKTNSPATTFKDVPVQRNYRTNIIGYLLTNPADFNILIDTDFETPDYNIFIVGGTKINPTPLENVMAEIVSKGIKDAVVTVPAGSYVSWQTLESHGSSPLVGVDNEVIETVTIKGEGENSVFVATGAGVGSIRAANGGKVIFKDITVVDESVSYAENSWEFTYLEFAGNLEFENVVFKSGILLQTEGSENSLNATFTNCTFISEESDVYGVWIADGKTTFDNCKFKGTRGLKMNETYGSNVKEVVVDACEFGPLEKKPGVVIGTLDASTVVTIKNSSFIGCQAGDQGKYIYESDTDIESFTFSESNNNIVEDPADIITIATKEELIAFQKAVNEEGNSYSGKTIKLTADIDLANMDWEPIGQTGGNGVVAYFQGVFDGQNHTISNLKISPNATYGQGANYAAGLFGFVDAAGAVIKNLTIDKATVSGHHWTAVIAGYLSGTIQNCNVTNSNVTCTHANANACGDKAGTVTGYINSGSVKNCTASKCTVKAGRDAGQIVGAAKETQVDSCTATDVTVSATGDCTDDDAGKDIREEIIGRVL